MLEWSCCENTYPGFDRWRHVGLKSCSKWLLACWRACDVVKDWCGNEDLVERTIWTNTRTLPCGLGKASSACWSQSLLNPGTWFVTNVSCERTPLTTTSTIERLLTPPRTPKSTTSDLLLSQLYIYIYLLCVYVVRLFVRVKNYELSFSLLFVCVLKQQYLFV